MAALVSANEEGNHTGLPLPLTIAGKPITIPSQHTFPGTPVSSSIQRPGPLGGESSLHQMKLTLDTTCIIDFLKGDKTNIQILIDDGRNGLCELAVTSRIQHDISHEPLASELSKLPSLGIKKIGTVGRWDVSYYGEDYYAGDEIEKLEEKIRAIMFPGGKYDKHLNDIDHLLGHIIDKRDYFITSDKDFLDHRDQLKKTLNVKIVTPRQYVNSIRLNHPERDH